jgi:citrate synthase
MRQSHPQPRMQNEKAYELVTTVTPEHTGIPRTMVLTVSFALSPVIGLSCHRRQQIINPQT